MSTPFLRAPMRHATLLLFLGCNYEAPYNPAATSFPNVITGTVVAGDLDRTGTTLLLLADAANPMPPNGTGSPITFSTVPGTDYSGDEAGIRSAEYAITNVPDGEWVLTALMDLDNDFHPSVPVMGGSTCGDIVGGHLASLTDTSFAAIATAGGMAYDNITVTLGLSVPTERPAFGVSELADTITPGDPTGSIFRLESVGIEAAFGPELSLSLDGPLDLANPLPCQTAFFVHLRDSDGDNNIDPHPDYPPELMVPDVWPRVYLSWLGEPVDTNGDDQPDSFSRAAVAEGTTFVTEGVPYAPQLAAIDPSNPATIPPIGTPFPTTTLDVLFPSAIVRTDASGETATLTDPTTFPAGAWSVTIIAETGQTWTVPNELDTSLALSAAIPPPGVTSERDPTQGTWVELAP